MFDIEGFKKYMYEEELSPNTIDTYCTGVVQYSRRFSEITKSNMLKYKQELLKRWKPSTVNNRITAMLKYCKYKDIEMKVKQVKEPKKTSVENVISAEQYERLTNGLKSDGLLRWYCIVVLLGKTGMRISEAIRVTKKDIIAGKVTMSTKAHMRTIFFPKSLREDIAPYLDELRDNDTVMKNHRGGAITTRGVSGGLLKYGKKYGIPKEVMHPHSFRHFFAIEFLKRNNNIALLADLLGHNSVNVTQIYLRMSQKQQRDEIDKAVNW